MIAGEYTCLVGSREKKIVSPDSGHEIEIVDAQTAENTVERKKKITLRYEGNPVYFKKY